MRPALAQRCRPCLRLLLLRCSHQPLEEGSAYLRDTQPSMCIHAPSAKSDRSLGQESKVSPVFQLSCNRNAGGKTRTGPVPETAPVLALAAAPRQELGRQ